MTGVQIEGIEISSARGVGLDTGLADKGFSGCIEIVLVARGGENRIAEQRENEGREVGITPPPAYKEREQDREIWH